MPNPDEPEPKRHFTAEHAENTEKIDYQNVTTQPQWCHSVLDTESIL